MHAWDRLSTGGRVTLLYVLLAVVWAATQYGRQSARDWDRERTRNRQVLTEEALQHLESGGEIAVPRWHGGRTTLRADLEVDLDQLTDADVDVDQEPSEDVDEE